MTFTTPLALLALILVPLFVFATLAWQRHVCRQMATLSRHAASPTKKRFYVQLTLLLGALSLLLIALAGPRWGRTVEEVTIRSRNVMLAVDVSRSMLAQDVHPNRLGRAKADLIDLVDVLQGDRAGLVAFRGKAVVLCPMTTDRAYLRQTIDALEPDSAPPGETDLADAIAKCLAAFEQAQSDHNAIVLISDGEDLAGEAETLATEAGKRKIPIFTVGIGSTQGATIPDGTKTLMHDGDVVRSQLTETTLRTIADAAGGRYIPLATAGTARTTLGAVYTRYLTQLADQEAREQIETAFTDRTGGFVFVAVILLLVAASLSLGRIAIAASALFLLTATLSAQDARDAQRAYRKGHFEEAASAYATARSQAEASEAAHYAYNEALALWKANNPTNALERVRLAIQDRDFAARANTLEGTLLMTMAETEEALPERLKLRESALAAFTRALQADPSESAQRNLARAQEGLETLREEVRRENALAKYKEQHLGQLIPELLQQQRTLMAAAPEVFSLSQPHARLAQAEQLARDVKTQADRWYPVLEALPQAVEDETLRAELLTQAKSAQEALDAAAAEYETLSDNITPLVAGEPLVYKLWKSVAEPPGLNNEAIAVQENAIKGGASYQSAREDQPEVLELLQQFRLVFPKWAEEKLQQQAAQAAPVEEGTASPPPEAPQQSSFTQEDIDIINKTADATVPLLTPPVDATTQNQILENLKLIREHLPKDPNQSSSQQSQSSPQDQQNQQQQSQSDPNEAQDQSPQEQEASAQPQEDSSDEKQQELEALLQKAVDREREHEDEKRRLTPRVPASTRDW